MLPLGSLPSETRGNIIGCHSHHLTYHKPYGAFQSHSMKVREEERQASWIRGQAATRRRLPWCPGRAKRVLTLPSHLTTACWAEAPGSSLVKQFHYLSTSRVHSFKLVPVGDPIGPGFRVYFLQIGPKQRWCTSHPNTPCLNKGNIKRIHSNTKKKKRKEKKFSTGLLKNQWGFEITH